MKGSDSTPGSVFNQSPAAPKISTVVNPDGSKNTTVQAGCLIFVLSARDGTSSNAKDFEYIKNKALCQDALVETHNFDPHNSRIYLRQCIDVYTEIETESLTIPGEIGGFLMNMTMGNPHLINIVAEYLIDEKILERKGRSDENMTPGRWSWYPHSKSQNATNSKGLQTFFMSNDERVKLRNHLNAQEIPGIVGIAFSHFDRMPADQQHLIKVIAALQMQFFSLRHVHIALGDDADGKEQAMLDALCQKDILRKAKDTDNPNHGIDQVNHHSGVEEKPFPEKHPSTHSEDEKLEHKKHQEGAHQDWIENEIIPNKDPRGVEAKKRASAVAEAGLGQSVKFGGAETKMIDRSSATRGSKMDDRAHMEVHDVTQYYNADGTWRENKDSTSKDDEQTGKMAHMLLRKASAAKEKEEEKNTNARGEPVPPENGVAEGGMGSARKPSSRKSANLDDRGNAVEEEYTFAASFWRLAAEKLVLKSQFEAMHQRKIDAGIASQGDVVIDRIGRSQTISLRHPFPDDDSDEDIHSESDPYSRKSMSSNEGGSKSKKTEKAHVTLVLDAKTGRMSTPEGEHVENTTHIDHVDSHGEVHHSRTLPRQAPVVKSDPRRDTAQESEGGGTEIPYPGASGLHYQAGVDTPHSKQGSDKVAGMDGPLGNMNNNGTSTNGKSNGNLQVLAQNEREPTRATAPLMKTPAVIPQQQAKSK